MVYCFCSCWIGHIHSSHSIWAFVYFDSEHKKISPGILFGHHFAHCWESNTFPSKSGLLTIPNSQLFLALSIYKSISHLDQPPASTFPAESFGSARPLSSLLSALEFALPRCTLIYRKCSSFQGWLHRVLVYGEISLSRNWWLSFPAGETLWKKTC